MKKPYEKPMIAVEEYGLTQAIAACVTEIGYLNSECVKYDPDSTDQMKDFAWIGWFVDANNCAESASGMDGYDKICYHTNANAAFTPNS